MAGEPIRTYGISAEVHTTAHGTMQTLSFRLGDGNGHVEAITWSSHTKAEDIAAGLRVTADNILRMAPGHLRKARE